MSILSFLSQTLLVLSLATLALSQEYLITPIASSQSTCHTNTTCFTLDQLAQGFLTNGAKLILIFEPGEHTLTQLFSIRNFAHVQMIGQNTSVLTFHDKGRIVLAGIDHLSIVGLTFTGRAMSENTLPLQYLRITNTHDVYIKTCSFIGLDARYKKYDGSLNAQTVYERIIHLQNTVKVLIQDSIFRGNIGRTLMISETGGTVSVKNSTFTRNDGWLGVVNINSENATVIIQHSIFTENTGKRGKGGAIYIASGEVCISHSTLSKNNAWDIDGGGIYVKSGSVSISHSKLIGNNVTRGGGIYVKSGNVSILHSTLADNRVHYYVGGGIFVSSGSVSISHATLTGNSAYHGGGIYVRSGSVSISHSILAKNSAYDHCGGISVNSESGSVSISHSTLTDRICVRGGGAASITNSTLTRNSPTGIFLSNSSSVLITKSILTGTDIHATMSSLEIFDTWITNNTKMFISQSTLTFLGENTISNSKRSIYAVNSQVHFNGPTVIDNNHGTSGGAIEAVQSAVYFNSALTISNNTATKYGGGVFMRESSLFVNSPATISHNTAHEGGAIYAYQSTIEFSNTGHRSMIANNVANNNGGGIYATASIIKLSRSFTHVHSNTAKAKGGGLYLQQNSRLYILKLTPERSRTYLKVGLTVSNNKALLGGGMYVNDSTSGGAVCNSQATETVFVGECFIQTIKLHAIKFRSGDNIVNTFISDNTANQSGNALHGGLLDRCTVSPLAELMDVPSAANGLEYVRRTIELRMEEISSDPLRVELCDISSNFTVFARKGEPFQLCVKALDQVGNPVNATIHGSVVTKSGVGRLKEGQVEQKVGQGCTELEYNVFSEDSSAQVELYAIGPCSNLGISKLTLTIMFLNCTCPLGFHPSQSNIECSCECDPELQAVECFPKEETFQPDSKLWIGAAIFTDCNDTGYLVHNCPFDYCLDQADNISLDSSQHIDRQCAYNRSGVLCGECEQGLSLVLATSKCKECSNIYLLLLIPFAVAGIVLVAFILWLNITVATGTIYGLILYANVLAANKAIFLPFPAPNFLTVFVSWVNLDLGIETCFYDGMSSQAKVLLQLAFPVYLFLLMFLIIILCKYIDSFAKLLSNRNPVAALCTLLVLTYSKLIRMIIAALQFTSLECPDGSVRIAWLYDANVQYYSLNHTPLFVAAAIILTACALFTTLLFFGQWFLRYSKWKVMKWTKNTKYIGFMDAFHAPFTPKHRYWPGLLLFALIAHNLAASMAPDTSVPVLSAGCVAAGLNLYSKLLLNQVYNNRLNNALETLFLLNMTILALGTFTINSNTNSQLKLANVSMAIAFILCVVLICYHFYKYVLKKTEVWNKKPINKQTRPFKQVKSRLKDRKQKNVELQEILNMHSYGHEPTEETDPDKYITPPIIRPATKPDQLREPDLDILAPITEDDYRQSSQIPQAENSVCPKPGVTSTVIEIDWKNKDLILKNLQNL